MSLSPSLSLLPSLFYLSLFLVLFPSPPPSQMQKYEVLFHLDTTCADPHLLTNSKISYH
jgi:hypothetical protein